MEHVACMDNLHAANIIALRCWPGRPQILSGSGGGHVLRFRQVHPMPAASRHAMRILLKPPWWRKRCREW